MQKNKKPSHRLLPFQIFAFGLFILACAVIIYDIFWGHFLFGKGYGPGAYYYTDVPNWKAIFIDSPYLGFKNPVLSFTFFFLWAFLSYRILCWLDKKL